MSEQLDHPTSTRSRFLGFFTSPIGAASGWILGALGLAVTIYSFYWGENHRELTAKIPETRTAVVVAGQASALKVFYEDTAIKGDVSAAQITLWNAGKQTSSPLMSSLR